MVLDNFVAAIPVRLLHIIYPMIYGLVYVAWSVIYFYMDPENNVLYVKLLDWNYPEITIPVILGVLFLMMPLIQLFWFGCYRLRLTIFQKCYHYRYCDPDTMWCNLVSFCIVTRKYGYFLPSAVDTNMVWITIVWYSDRGFHSLPTDPKCHLKPDLGRVFAETFTFINLIYFLNGNLFSCDGWHAMVSTHGRVPIVLFCFS